ncbi:hypothetical protein N7492_008644 [Penicillium capsulatum]|uniref:Uncharacterized protein n=1 Tax=Penicillium capsulatum TaxID=69766 RepID=A0A9W9HTW1_9EURO|nr:hypothetical protein N7492_008644 [Penicillium capsulatum]KAJ6106048.1 hypothetical protein N7512_009565 [Penicillium capsulatum]
MDDIQATAKWANRMLRPLTSIYRRLEKHQETLAIIAAESRGPTQPVCGSQEAQSSIDGPGTLDGYSGSDADEDDPVWVPGRKPQKRRIRHKYTGRGEGQNGRKRTRLSIHSPDTPRTLPGAIELATPLITGKRWEMPDSAHSQLSVELPRAQPAQEQRQAFRDRYSLHKSPWQELLVQSGDTGFADIAHNLDRVLQNFLCNTRTSKRNTADTSSRPKLGTRSLLMTVMRRLPEFIAAEQEFQDEAEEDMDEDMCDAYFTELESFYAPHGRGWKPLREAVRAQGIYLVSMMIRNHWVTDAVACALVEKCGHQEPDACEELLSTFLSTREDYFHPPALRPQINASDPGDPIRILRKYAHHATARRSYIFNELSKLLMRGVLPPQWMATKTWTSWMTRATISFSKSDFDCAAASRLIEAALLSACDARPTSDNRRSTSGHRTVHSEHPKGALTGTEAAGRPCSVLVEDALSNHITSLLAALCGMHISRSRDVDRPEEADGIKASHIISYLSLVIERDMENNERGHLSSHELLRRGSIVLAHCLTQCNDAVLAGDVQFEVTLSPVIDGLSERLASRSHLVKELALLVRQAFRCFGSATDRERHCMGKEIRRMVSRLPHLSEAPGLSLLLRRVAVETAMGFAESTGEPEDHLWAVEIQETALQSPEESSPDSANESDEPGHRTGLYRWEESIGEWVARTPAAKPNVPAVWGKARASTPKVLPYIACSTDSSSLESDCFEQAAPSLTSSPSSISPKRDFEEVDSSPLRPIKRRRAAPVIVYEQAAGDQDASLSASDSSRSPSPEPVRSHRRSLREISNSTSNLAAPARPAPAKVEVVIINNHESDPLQEPVQHGPVHVEKRVHRTMARRRAGRLSTSTGSTGAARQVPPRRIIPCSESDSDDELSFI